MNACCFRYNLWIRDFVCIKPAHHVDSSGLLYHVCMCYAL